MLIGIVALSRRAAFLASALERWAEFVERRLEQPGRVGVVIEQVVASADVLDERVTAGHVLWTTGTRADYKAALLPIDLLAASRSRANTVSANDAVNATA